MRHVRHALQAAAHLAVVRAGTNWELMASNDLGEPLFATPALAEGRIYVRGQKSLFSFGAPFAPAAAPR